MSEDTNTGKAWEQHYTRNRSVLHYPDENLVRLLKGLLSETNAASMLALDAGCGTGRHMKLMNELEIGTVLGVDQSSNALQACRRAMDVPVVCANLNRLPLGDHFFDIVVSWGSLHYCSKDESLSIIRELYRVLKPGGWLMGTLRGTRDTFLKRQGHLGSNSWIIETADIRNSIVSFFDEEELPGLLSDFSHLQYGIMERSIIGRPEMIISHWFFRAEK